MKQVRIAKVLVLAFAVLALCGCLGKAPPVEEYLSVRPATVQPCEEAALQGVHRMTVALKPFKAVDALDRQAVLLGQGRVRRPSMAWYWESTPAAMVDQALVRGLSCSPAVLPVWPVRSTTKTDRVLTGMVNAFWVDTATGMLSVCARAQLWDAGQTGVLSVREFSVQAKASALNAQGVAEAGSRALSELAREVSAWLEAQNRGAKGLPSASEERIEK